MGKYIWGIDIGGTAIKIGIFTPKGKEITNFDIETVVIAHLVILIFGL